MQHLTRRRFLASATGGAAAASLGLWGARPPHAQAQPGNDALTDLGNGFRVLRAGDVNVLAVSSGEGIALVDGGAAAESAALLRRVAALPGGGKVHTLFNTHWHPEQTGSNEALGRSGTTIVAQMNTKQWLSTDITWPYDNQKFARLPEPARPNKTFYGHEELEVGGKRVVCGHLRDCPHTDGDMYVFFPDDNVLAVGDAITGGGWPAIDWWTGGWIGGIVGGIDMLASVANPGTKIVPARGRVLTAEDLRTQYRMYSTVWEGLAKVLYGGGGPAEALAANPAKEFNDIMGPSDAFVRRAFESLWAYLSPDA